MNEIVQLKITLQGTKPPIWRRIIASKTMTFEELHTVIQITMGWTNSHLYEFNINGQRFAEHNEDIDMEFGDKSVDASAVTLDSIITSTKQQFEYIYDFGDSWEHLIIVEKFLNSDTNTNHPICIDGKLNCPPEDCGGIYSFYNMIDTIGNKRHPERNEMLNWLGGKYDLEHFDKDEINQELASLFKNTNDKKNYR